MSIKDEIAASVNDVDKLLESNAKMSIAFLAMRLKQHKEETQRLAGLLRREVHETNQRINSLVTRVAKLEERISYAGMKFTDMSLDLTAIKADLEDLKPIKPEPEETNGRA